MPKDEVVVLRVTQAEKAVLTAKAVSEGRTLGGWARWVLEREAGVEMPDIGRMLGADLTRDIVPNTVPVVVPDAGRKPVKLKPGVEEAVRKQQAKGRRPGERCPHCNQKKCKGECW